MTEKDYPGRQTSGFKDAQFEMDGSDCSMDGANTGKGEEDNQDGSAKVKVFGDKCTMGDIK